MSWTDPRTWSDGETVDADMLNTIRDALKAIGDPWSAWTPTLTSLALGSGTLVARYLQAGRLVHFYFDFILGAGSAVGTNPAFTLPVPARSAAAVRGLTCAYLVGSVNYSGRTFNETTTAVTLAVDTSGSNQGNVTATVPGTFAAGSILHCHGTYEAA